MRQAKSRTSSRSPSCRSGRTAASSCSPRRSSTYLPPGGDLVADVCGTLAGRGQAVRLSVRRILEARRHLQGTGRARRPIPQWRSTVDALGACRRRVVWRRRRGPMISLCTGALAEIAVVGAHCDDIAIGMGGTLLSLAESRSRATRPRAGAVRRRHRTRGRGDETRSPRSVPVPTSK